MKLSDHFTLAEAVFSRTASKRNIDNTPSPEEIAVLIKTATQMEKVRALLGNRPITVSSWFRSPKLSVAIGSSIRSQHCKAEAVDFMCHSFGSVRDICERIIDHKELIKYDQLILENGWVHISFAIVSRKIPRSQVLTITPDGKTHLGLVHYK
jgi:zinc D-Ala-D-Ala carboxypeptidase